MKRVKKIGILLAALCFALAGTLMGNASVRAASDQGMELVEEISELIEEAEKSRAADPKFLNELRQALDEYQGPKFVELMKDDFHDGNISRNPRWNTAEGEFTVSRRHGLMAVAPKPEPSEADALAETLKEMEAKKADKGRYTLVQSATLNGKPYVPVGEEIERIQAVIKAEGGPSEMENRLAQLREIRENSGRYTLVQSIFLSGKPSVPVGDEIERTEQAVEKEKAEKAAEMATLAKARAELFTNLAISNAFSVQLELVSRERGGRIEVDIFQGSRRNSGYRLAYNAGVSPGFEILRFGRSGARLLAAHKQVVNLEDGYRHRLLFARDDSGGMSLTLDGRAVLQVSDRSFRDPFAGIALATEGGDFAVREVSVLGVK